MEGVSAKFKIEDKWFDHEDHKYKNQISNSLENSFDNSSLCIHLACILVNLSNNYCNINREKPNELFDNKLSIKQMYFSWFIIEIDSLVKNNFALMHIYFYHMIID